MAAESVTNPVALRDPFSEHWIDVRLISGMRVVLGIAALLVSILDTVNNGTWSIPTVIALALYSLYGAFIYQLSARRNPIATHKIIPWLDLLWYIPLITFAGSGNSIFRYFFFFAITVASFSWGLRDGLRLTLASAAVYVLASLIAGTSGPLQVNQLLMATIGLLTFGYIIARWGGYHTELKNRLKLLKDVTVFSNPRYGIDRTIKAILESILVFYDADVCLLVIPGKPGAETYQMYHVTRGTTPSRSAPPEIGQKAAAQFLAPSLDQAVIYNRNRAGSSQTRLFDVKTKLFSETNSNDSDKLAGMLDAQRYLSMPVYYRHQPVGRLYIINGPTRIESPDMEFLLQLMDHVTPVMENIRLIDNLASDAAEQERRRIAADIHDSVIQPYLGLQFGLSALDQKLESGNTAIRGDIQELLELTNHELAELRRFVWGLRAGEERTDVLLPAIERYAERFSLVTGIKVDVEARGKVKVNDRLAAEVFQIVAEGLSNVRRHAFCRDARVEISCKNSSLLLQIKNSRPRANPEHERGDGHENVKTFRPHSIAERAALLGGDTQVFVDEMDYTVVSVGIPL
jgi:signal transduction histidine kinase